MTKRERTIDIHLRVTPQEKRQLTRLARRSGLSLSGYLRKVGYGDQISATHPAVFQELYRQVNRLRTQAPESLAGQLDELAQQLLAAYTGGPHGDD